MNKTLERLALERHPALHGMHDRPLETPTASGCQQGHGDEHQKRCLHGLDYEASSPRDHLLITSPPFWLPN